MPLIASFNTYIMMNNPLEYLNENVKCRIAPSEFGCGVFSIRDIKSGELLTDFDGRNFINLKLEEDEFETLTPELKGLILERTFFDKNKPLIFMSPNCNQVLQAFMNHSDTPNSDGMYAIEDIEKGKEITFDYRNITENPHPLTVGKMNFL